MTSWSWGISPSTLQNNIKVGTRDCISDFLSTDRLHEKWSRLKKNFFLSNLIKLFKSVQRLQTKAAWPVAASKHRSSAGPEIELKASGGASGCRYTVHTGPRAKAPNTGTTTLLFLKCVGSCESPGHHFGRPNQRLKVPVHGRLSKFTQKLGNKIQWFFHDFSKTNLSFPWLRNDDNPAFWGKFLLDDKKNVSKSTKYLDPKMKFHNFSTISAIFPQIHDFSRPEKWIFKFHDFSWPYKLR